MRSGTPEDHRTGEFEESRRGWKLCACLIHATGTIGGKFNRRNTGQIEWEPAKTIISRWETAANWGDAPAPQPSVPPIPEGITIERAVNAFMAEFAESAASSTQKKYRLLLKNLQTFNR
jgi:hypothetical protein